MAERAFIVSTLISCGVPARDSADVAQAVVLGAWQAIEADRYRPDPAVNARQVLRRWLRGVAWRQATHYLESAYVRHEVLHHEPVGPLRHVVGLNLEAQLQARAEMETLLALWQMPLWAREVLALAALGHEGTEIASVLHLHRGTAVSRLRRARKLLACMRKRKGGR
ncbi:sigma-70 family RNA polymerase sigma factor [Sorangium sp. So ce321]|uniref:RNA polymerase sigma factor n=1 Tax=Sorangium sp. So ce321 TaxID=3133300 RepID=UPI003F606188